MRTKEQIESEIPQFMDGSFELKYLRNIQELLLDIRDLLKPLADEANSHMQAKQATPPPQD